MSDLGAGDEPTRMDWGEQRLSDLARYSVIPRALVFLEHENEWLVQRGAPTKRLWANRLNGVGGHCEPGETPIECARREILEETGLVVQALELRAIVHIQGDAANRDAGVMMFVYVGQAPHRRVCANAEGRLEWHTLDALLGPQRSQLVQDLPELLPRIVGERRGDGRMLYGHYAPDSEGRAQFHYDLA